MHLVRALCGVQKQLVPLCLIKALSSHRKLSGNYPNLKVFGHSTLLDESIMDQAGRVPESFSYHFPSPLWRSAAKDQPTIFV